MELQEKDKEAIVTEEREQLRDEFRKEELKYNEELAEESDALKGAVDSRMAEYIDKHGDLR